MRPAATDRHSDTAITDFDTIELTLSRAMIAPDCGASMAEEINELGDSPMMTAAGDRLPHSPVRI
jgi:hypothetical protein